MNTYDKDLGFCIFCEQPVYRNRDQYRLILDRPIKIDLPVHKTCFHKHRDLGNIKAFLQDTLLDYLEKYYDEDSNGEKEKTHKYYKARTSGH